MKRKSLFLLLMTIMMVLLTSCWSKKELTDLALVSAMGIDKTKEGRYELTFQIINPGNVAGLHVARFLLHMPLFSIIPVLLLIIAFLRNRKKQHG